MNESDSDKLAEAMNLQADRHVRAICVPYFWIGSGMSGEDGQFADRDLQQARRERKDWVRD